MPSVVSAGAPLPERPNRRWEKVISPVGQTPLAITFLSPGFTGFWTHWIGRPLPCPGPENGCEHCGKLGARWTGYAAVWADMLRQPRILMLSEGAARQLLPILVKSGSLRGLSFWLQRKGDKVNAPIYVKERGRVPEDHLIPDFDIMPSLHKLWGVAEQYLAGRPRQVRKESTPPDDWIRTPKIVDFPTEEDDPLA